jgi:hypothetical protein
MGAGVYCRQNPRDLDISTERMFKIGALVIQIFDANGQPA